MSKGSAFGRRVVTGPSKTMGSRSASRQPVQEVLDEEEGIEPPAGDPVQLFIKFSATAIGGFVIVMAVVWMMIPSDRPIVSRDSGIEITHTPPGH